VPAADGANSPSRRRSRGRADPARGVEEGRQRGILAQALALVGTSERAHHAQRRHHKGAALAQQGQQGGIGGRIAVDVHQPGGAGGDDRAGALDRRHMGDRLQPGGLAGRQQGGDARRIEGGEVDMLAVAVAVVEHELDEVRTLLNAAFHHSRGIGWGIEGVQRNAELGAVAALGGDQGTGRPDVRQCAVGERLAVAAVVGQCRRRTEHVDRAGDAEAQHLRPRLAPGVHVGVDQAGQQGAAAAADFGGVAHLGEALGDGGDAAVAHQHVGARPDAVAVEHPRLADHEDARRAAARIRRIAARRRCRHPQQRHQQRRRHDHDAMQSVHALTPRGPDARRQGSGTTG
jgi:hypothetical protein